MHRPKFFFVGSQLEVAHHAAPLQTRLNLQIAEPYEVLLQAKPGDLAIFYSEHFDRFRDCCIRLKSMGVATLYMIDGILEWRNAWLNGPNEIACPYTMRPVLAHKVACIGPAQARVLRGWGNEQQTEIVGIPRLDHLGLPRNLRAKPTGQQASEFRLLVMTAKTPGFTPEQLELVRQSLADIKQWAAEHPRINGRSLKIVWRLTKNLADEIGVRNELSELSGKELAATLAEVDAVITTPSTAMLEAMLMDIPVAMLDYHNCPHYLASAWTIYGAEHLSSVVQQLESRDERRMFYQREQLLDGLLCQNDATDRFVELVEKMADCAAKQLAENTSATPQLYFPPNLLNHPPQLAASFQHAKLFQELADPIARNQIELAVELAHSRREIKKLQRDIGSLQLELDQAHAIFQQIEDHPIAGPIVRVRQKMLDLVESITHRKFSNESATAVPVSKTVKQSEVTAKNNGNFQTKSHN